MKNQEGSGQEMRRGEEFVNGQAVTFALIDQERFMRDTKERIDKIKNLDDLPFVKDTVTGKGKGKEVTRSYWSVNPSGDYTKDCQTGHEYAAMYHAYTRNNPDTGGTLQHIVFSIMESGDLKKDRGLIVGFFYGIDATLAPIDIPRSLFRDEIVKKWMETYFKNQPKRKHFLPYEWEYKGVSGEKEAAA